MFKSELLGSKPKHYQGKNARHISDNKLNKTSKSNPIVGDKLYQKKNKKFKRIDIELNSMIKNINRQFLHAKSLGFIHPLNNEKVRFEVPLPKDLSKLVKKLRNLSK